MRNMSIIKTNLFYQYSNAKFSLGNDVSKNTSFLKGVDSFI